MNGATAPPGIRIAGTGMCLPDRVLTNDELAGMVDTSDAWIAQRTGIRQRRIAENGTGALELAEEAVRGALEAAALEPGALDLLLCATLTPEMACPSTAARLVDRLGAVPAGAMDLSAACSGFVYALNTAAALIATGACRHVAVTGVEVLSQVTDWEDRRTCILFGDGAGAAILSACDDPGAGSLYQSMASDGGAWRHLYIPRRPADVPEGCESFSGKLGTLQMNGREVYKFAVTTLQRTIAAALEACDLTPDDLAMVIPHQSNARILESARDRLGFAPEKFCINIDRYGNTSAASVPISLHELVESGRLKRGDLVLFVALGGGLTWSANLWRL